MIKASLIISIVMATLLSIGLKAQSNADYFAGKWKITIMGTPNGDATLTFIFAKKDSTLTGVIRDSTDTEIAKITNIEQSGKTITAYFSSQGYDVNLLLEPVDADTVKGSMMSMFDAKGFRVKDGGK